MVRDGFADLEDILEEWDIEDTFFRLVTPLPTLEITMMRLVVPQTSII